MLFPCLAKKFEKKEKHRNENRFELLPNFLWNIDSIRLPIWSTKEAKFLVISVG